MQRAISFHRWLDHPLILQNCIHVIRQSTIQVCKCKNKTIQKQYHNCPTSEKVKMVNLKEKSSIQTSALTKSNQTRLINNCNQTWRMVISCKSRTQVLATSRLILQVLSQINMLVRQLTILRLIVNLGLFQRVLEDKERRLCRLILGRRGMLILTRHQDRLLPRSILVPCLRLISNIRVGPMTIQLPKLKHMVVLIQVFATTNTTATLNHTLNLIATLHG